MNRYANIMIIVLAMLSVAGCAITPKDPSITLGSSWQGPEEVANAITFVKPPHIRDGARGFEIAVPLGVVPLGCKIWRNLDGEEVPVCRTAARARLDGRKSSTYPYMGGWYVFSVERPMQVIMLSYDGRAVLAPIVREVSANELREIYADLLATFNCESDYENLLYTDPSGQCKATPGDKIDVPELGVPSLNDDKERCAYAGLCKGSTNPLTYVYGAANYAFFTKPRRLDGK